MLPPRTGWPPVPFRPSMPFFPLLPFGVPTPPDPLCPPVLIAKRLSQRDNPLDAP